MNNNDGSNLLVVVAGICILFGIFVDTVTNGNGAKIGIGSIWICIFLNNIACAIREDNKK